MTCEESILFSHNNSWGRSWTNNQLHLPYNYISIATTNGLPSTMELTSSVTLDGVPFPASELRLETLNRTCWLGAKLILASVWVAGTVAVSRHSWPVVSPCSICIWSAAAVWATLGGRLHDSSTVQVLSCFNMTLWGGSGGSAWTQNIKIVITDVAAGATKDGDKRMNTANCC